MKKKLVATILGLVAAASVFNAGNVANAQGQVYLDTYGSTAGNYPLITYGAGAGGSLNSGVTAGSGFTVGLYFSASPINAVATTSGNLDTSVPTGTLATGAGATALFRTEVAGLFTSVGDVYFNTGLAAGSTLNFVVVAYNGASYETSLVRGHSQSFSLTTAAAPPIPSMSGVSNIGPMGSFQVVAVPEPSTFALAGLGLASLLIFRRRK